MRDGEPVPVDENSFGPDINTDFVIEFIEKNKQKPFFVYYPSILMHGPATSTPDSRASDKKGRDTRWAAMANHLDKNVARIVDVLEKNGLRENTVILFTTDNGNCGHTTYTFRGETRETEKGSPTDGGTHAPLIVNCPGVVPEGLVVDDLVDFSDFLPTIADISGAALPDVPLDGRSFWPQCRGEKGSPRDWIFQCWFPKGKGGQRWAKGESYVMWAQDRDYKLYSHGKFIEVADRLETKDIPAGTGSQQAEAARRKLQAAIDSMPKSNPLMNQNEKGDRKSGTGGESKKGKVEGSKS
jgi:arylsulfatase A